MLDKDTDRRGRSKRCGIGNGACSGRRWNCDAGGRVTRLVSVGDEVGGGIGDDGADGHGGGGGIGVGDDGGDLQSRGSGADVAWF